MCVSALAFVSPCTYLFCIPKFVGWGIVIICIVIVGSMSML